MTDDSATTKFDMACPYVHMKKVSSPKFYVKSKSVSHEGKSLARSGVYPPTPLRVAEVSSQKEAVVVVVTDGEGEGRCTRCRHSHRGIQ
jgi:hypothetical protein